MKIYLKPNSRVEYIARQLAEHRHALYEEGFNLDSIDMRLISGTPFHDETYIDSIQESKPQTVKIVSHPYFTEYLNWYKYNKRLRLLTA